MKTERGCGVRRKECLRQSSKILSDEIEEEPAKKNKKALELVIKPGQ